MSSRSVSLLSHMSDRHCVTVAGAQEFRTTTFPSIEAQICTTLPDLSISDAHFPVLVITVIRSRFQVKPATLLISIGVFLYLLVEESHSTRYQSGSISLINVGSGFHCQRSFFGLSLSSVSVCLMLIML